MTMRRALPILSCLILMLLVVACYDGHTIINFEIDTAADAPDRVPIDLLKVRISASTTPGKAEPPNEQQPHLCPTVAKTFDMTDGSTQWPLSIVVATKDISQWRCIGYEATGIWRDGDDDREVIYVSSRVCPDWTGETHRIFLYKVCEYLDEENRSCGADSGLYCAGQGEEGELDCNFTAQVDGYFPSVPPPEGWATEESCNTYH